MKRTNGLRNNIFIFLGIVVMQISLLYLYWIHTDDIKNFKLVYLPVVYAKIWKYEFGQRWRDISVFFRQPANVLSAEDEKNAHALPVLLYHSIVDTPDGANVTVQNFVSQMMELKKKGYQTITIDDFYEFLQGKKQLSEKSVLITFDDGSKTTYYPVDPVLKVLGYNAVSYIITNYNIGEGTRYYLSSKEIKNMLASGRWQVQLHTDIGHVQYQIDQKGSTGRYYPNKLWKSTEKRLETDEEYKLRIQTEIHHGKEKIEKEFGINSLTFAYPYGDYAQNATNYPQARSVLYSVLNDIFPVVFYQVYKGGGYTMNYPGETGNMKKRIIVQPEWTAEDLIHTLESGEPKDLPFDDNFHSDTGWMNTWGQEKLKSDGMHVTTDNTEGGSMFLDGTYDWKDYSVHVEAVWTKGDSFSVLSRYIDNDTFISCNMNENYVTLDQSVHGQITELAHKDVHQILRNNISFSVDMDVRGAQARCYSNGKLLLDFQGLDPVLSTGGIGFKNWSDTMNDSELIIKKVHVESLR